MKQKVIPILIVIAGFLLLAYPFLVTICLRKVPDQRWKAIRKRRT